MDDTLVATAALWRQADEHLFHLIGSEWSAEIAQQYKGMNSLDVAATIHRLLRPAASLEICQKILREALFAAFDANPPEPMPGAVECIQRLRGLAPLALASGSPLPLIESVLARLELRSAFTCLISSESVPRGKPFPDVFLAAAAKAGMQPQTCLVVEDSLVGIRAARAAGMVCFAIPSSQSQEIATEADRTFASLKEIYPQTISLMPN